MTTIDSQISSLTSLLIASPVHYSNGSVDSNPGPTIVNGQPVSAILELRSTDGALLISKMTTAERDDLNSDNGMIIYNRQTNSFNLRVNDEWVNLVSILADGVENDIVVFGATSGSLRDSGVTIADFFPPQIQNIDSSLAPGNDIALSNLTYLQFLENSGFVFLGLQAGVQIFSQPSPQNICVLISDGGIPSGPSSPSCAFEINTRNGALLLSRMLDSDVSSLPTPNDGMILFNETPKIMQVRRGGDNVGVGGVWANVSTNPQNLKIIDFDYQMLLIDDFISVETPTIAPLQPIITLPSDPEKGQTYTIYDGQGNADISVISAYGNGRAINGEGQSQIDVIEQLNTVRNPIIMTITPNGVRGYVALNHAETAFPYFADVSQGGSAAFQVFTGLNGGNTPRCIAISSNGLYGYIGNFVGIAPSIGIFNNATTGTPSVTQNTGIISDNPIKIAITGNGNIYVTTESNSIIIYSGGNSGVPFHEGSFTGITGALNIAITPNGDRAYVTTSAGVTVIGNASFSGGPRPSIIATIPLDTSGFGCNAVVITPDGNLAYVSCNSGSEKIFLIRNVTTGTPSSNPIDDFNLDWSPSMAITPNGKFLYISNGSNTIDSEAIVTLMDKASTGSPVKLFDIKVGPSAKGIAINPNGDYAYVCNFDTLTPPWTITKLKNASGTPVVIIDDKYDGSQLIYNGTSWNAFHMPSKPGSD